MLFKTKIAGFQLDATKGQFRLKANTQKAIEKHIFISIEENFAIHLFFCNYFQSEPSLKVEIF